MESYFNYELLTPKNDFEVKFSETAQYTDVPMGHHSASDGSLHQI